MPRFNQTGQMGQGLMAGRSRGRFVEIEQITENVETDRLMNRRLKRRLRDGSCMENERGFGRKGDFSQGRGRGVGCKVQEF